MTLKITMPGEQSGPTFSQLRLFLCFLMYCWVLADPVCGYFLKNCTIRGNLSDPSNMKVLCEKRNLEVIPKDIPRKVSVLDVAMNNISKIGKLDFKGLSNLKILNMSRNQISQLDNGSLRHLEALQELGLAHNRLTTLSDYLFQGLANLSLLHLDNNLITTIASSSFQLLSSLKTVNLTKNNLYNMKEVQPIVQLPHLQELYIGSNKFTSFQSQEISNTSIELRLLDLSRNPLGVFRITTDVLPYLEVLDIAYCGQLGHMEWDVLDRSFLRNVKRLNLSGIEMSLERMSMVLQTVNSSLVHLRLYDISEERVKALTDIACHIPTLSLLRLHHNNISVLSKEFLQSCKQLTEMDVCDNNINRLSELLFRSMEQLSTLKLGHNRLSSMPKATRNLPTLKILDLSFNIIHELGCPDFANLTGLTQLFLFHNQISNLPGCVFQDLKDLRILKLGSNKILTLNDAFMSGLHKLEYLSMSYNKLSSISKGDFKGLASLKTLLLFDNQIASLEDGAFEGLVNLTELRLQSNKITQIDIRNTVLTGLPSLRTLDISCNYITYVNDDKLDPPPFSHLTSLENLQIHSQRHKGLCHLPINFLEGLKYLLAFKAGNLNIKDLHPKTFIHTPRLWYLDISKNEFTALTPKLFHPTPRLNRMYLSKARLQSLDFLIGANLSRVTFLQVSKNDITVVNETVLQSLPALTYLDMQDNPFTCGCSDAWFVQWMESDNQTQVVGAGEFTCNYPADLKDTKLLDVELQFCIVHLGLYYYISTTCLVLLTLIASFAYHFLKWQVIYGYYLFLAFLYDTKQRNKLTPHGCQYDAFISYNAHDEPWVLRELLPELEGEQGWKLCLHHRDFQPGKPIIDNIMDGIYGSRKTICVISHRYLESEWCSREIQVASFRLFDEQKDVLILVFLEEIPTHQLSPYHRMRKLVKKRTYLSWPRVGEQTGVFWQQLRLALETKDGSAEENPILSGWRLCDTSSFESGAHEPEVVLVSCVSRHLKSEVDVKPLTMTLKITMPGEQSGSTFSQLRLFLCFLMYCWFLADPVCGYFLKNCTIRGNLSGPSNMKVLCEKRNLEVIPKDIPRRVSVLDVAMNNISKIGKLDFKGLSNLKILNMSRNQISQLDNGSLRHLEALQELGLAHNRLTTLSDHLFQGLANLSLLHLDNNLIATISSSSFQPLSSLKTVNLTKNNLYNMKEVQPIVQLPHLQELYIGSNRFTSFQSQEISNTSIELRLLDLSRNPLGIFRITADVLPYLEMLDIAYCGQLGHMEWDVLNRSFLSNVNRLNLSGIEMSFERMGMVLQTVNSSLVHLRLNDLVKGSKLKVKALTDIACHIPKLSVLRLEYNNIGNLSEEFLQSCKHMTEVDISNTGLIQLSEFSFRSIEQISALKLGHNRLSSVPKATRNLPTLKILDLSFNIINKLGCSDFSNLTGLTQLFLFHNQIPNLPGCVFQDLKELRILKLGSNKILTLNEAFMNGLHKLETLNLAGNKLSSIRKGEFKSLTSLKTLLLYDNQIASMEDGAFEGLVNLTELNLGSNKITQTDIRNTVLMGLPLLRSLDISCNYITYVNDDKLDPPPFSHLTSLENLQIHSQRHKGLCHLPINFLEGLKYLLAFKAGNLNIKDLHPNTFIHTPRLWYLDVSKNEFTALTPKLFHPTPRLNRMYLSKAQLQSLDFLIGANLSRVTFLQVSKNDITVVNETVLQSLPALTYLDMQDNPFTCGCSDAWFVQWMESDNQTQVVGAGELTCNYPADLKDTKLLDVELQFCTVDLGLYCYISTTCLVLLTLVASFAYNFLKWQVIYGYYLFLAFLYDTKQRNKRMPHGCQYDAFISYNAHDEPWVLSELLPELEGEQGWKLCLHHRDFQPGKPIIDNIMDGIYGSRKTICVISHRYLESEWCSREIQVASFRLFDEQKDVLILVFLEEIPTHQLSPYHRMRKLVKRRTYLSWPRAGEQTGVFWQQLRLALESKDGSAEENSILSGCRLCDSETLI
ncbi:LOW QUALITY PROTEIN: uncharacterized protein LOC115129781 [Oncorhynchus nerka]|uniref:LOW QUALITY PROTEIN: uncharacterized protein LOC115129781 n=1 Tax=Oncorhynchus nerka TaxID=8023 RepID=UPI0031B83390